MSTPVQIKRATWRLGARERGRLQALLVSIIIILLVIVLRPYYLHMIEIKDFQTCQNNLLKIGRALETYAKDWDDTLPLVEGWTDNVKTNMTSTTGTGFSIDAYFRCPKDHTTGQSSYLFNGMLAGLSPSVLQNSPELKKRRATLGRIDRAAAIIEKHGSLNNAHASITDWDAVAKMLDRPHKFSTMTGSCINGSFAVMSKNDEQLAALAGQRF